MVTGLPEFERPPVVEVALAIEFEQPMRFQALDLARFRDAWADWPVVEERPVLPPMEESNGGEDALADDLLKALLREDEPPPRLWLQNDAEDRVVQIQHDRLVVNWHKSDAGGDYPRYGSVRDHLQDAWDRLNDVYVDLGSNESVVPSLCEMQYVNHIDSGYGWTSPQDTERLMVPWQGVEGSKFFADNHLTYFNVHTHFPEDREGWLAIRCWTSHYSPDGPDDPSPLMVLSLTARGRVESGNFQSALDFFDVAHRWVVEGFIEITTQEAHKIWKRRP